MTGRCTAQLAYCAPRAVEWTGWPSDSRPGRLARPLIRRRPGHRPAIDEEMEERQMSDFTPGLEGVVAFETEIAEPDKEGGSLRYRGVDIEELVAHVPYGHVWGLLVDNAFAPGLPPAEPYPIPVHSGDIRVDVQSALAMLAPAWGMRQLLDIDDDQAREDLARASVMALSFVAQSARGPGLPPVLSGAVGAMSGPLHGGAPARVLSMIEEVERTGDAVKFVKASLDRGDRLMGFGHRVYRAEDPRARVLRRTARELGAPRAE